MALKIWKRIRDRLAFKSWYTDTQLLELSRRLDRIRMFTESSAALSKEKYVAELLADERYGDPLRLERHGFKVYSQSDEDGIIAEIFNRIGAPNKTFVEFGAQTGLENNTLYLLLQGWRGLWIEGNANYCSKIESLFANMLQGGELHLRHAFITVDNINSLISSAPFDEVDLLSIDIDGNDYHIWEAIEVVRPRVVVIEFNAKFPPSLSIAPVYAPNYVWSGDDYMGCSLEALVRLGKSKAYSLVCCNIAGVNAFFVRDDLVENRFQRPFTSENYHQPPRYFLIPLYVAGHAPAWGDYVPVPAPNASTRRDP